MDEIMLMGTVIEVNFRLGMFIDALDRGDYVVFELLSGIDIAKGDKISGELEDLDRTESKHLEQFCKFSAYGQSRPRSLTACRRLRET
ncbi:hypothetical protein [Herbaspirillum lusitanum]|uniref:hypothetical protein n=1 Tax=Herbaspirillum lusitanum TaxID=213312 RepID=UPI002238C528|nr:hypothetical protein [Herbaspirillum lusitanum]